MSLFHQFTDHTHTLIYIELCVPAAVAATGGALSFQHQSVDISRIDEALRMAMTSQGVKPMPFRGVTQIITAAYFISAPVAQCQNALTAIKTALEQSGVIEFVNILWLDRIGHHVRQAHYISDSMGHFELHDLARKIHAFQTALDQQSPSQASDSPSAKTTLLKAS